MRFQNVLLRCYVPLPGPWRRLCFYDINTMGLMPQISDVTADENISKCNELE